MILKNVAYLISGIFLATIICLIFVPIVLIAFFGRILFVQINKKRFGVIH